MKRIGVFLAEGFEEIEALTVVDICRRAGIEVIMAAVPGTDGDNPFVMGTHKIGVKADMNFEQVDFDSLDMVVLPGGMPGTRNLEAHAGLMEQVERFYREGRYVAAICAAPSILGHRGILKGRNACCYPKFEKELEGALVTENQVEISEHVITSRGMGCAIPFALAIVSIFCGEAKAAELANGIVFSQSGSGTV